MLGIALGVMALITVLSVMNGFEKELRHRILGMTAHATINSWIARWRSGIRFSAMPKTIRVYSVRPPIFRRRDVDQWTGGQWLALSRRAAGGGGAVSDIAEKMVAGSFATLAAGEYRIVLGAELARSLEVVVGDRVTLVTPTANVTPAGILPRLKRFTVGAIFEVGMHEYDSAMAYIHLDDARRLFRLEHGVTGLRLKVDDLLWLPLSAVSWRDHFPVSIWCATGPSITPIFPRYQDRKDSDVCDPAPYRCGSCV